MENKFQFKLILNGDVTEEFKKEIREELNAYCIGGAPSCFYNYEEMSYEKAYSLNSAIAVEPMLYGLDYSFVAKSLDGKEEKINFNHYNFKLKGLKVVLKNGLDDVDLNNCYSVGCGYDDRESHFDHHEGAGIPSPCVDSAMNDVKLTRDAIYVSYMDPSILLGIKRLVKAHSLRFDTTIYKGDSVKHYKLDLNLLADICDNGTSCVQDETNQTLLYYRGVEEKIRELGFPKASDVEQDITDLVDQLNSVSFVDLIDLGEKLQKGSGSNSKFEKSNMFSKS